MTDRGVQLGQIRAWFNPRYDDDTRTEFIIQPKRSAIPRPGWGGRASISELSLVQRVLDETSTITVATAIVDTWTNDPAHRRVLSAHCGPTR